MCCHRLGRCIQAGLMKMNIARREEVPGKRTVMRTILATT
jgi:hypothetical protein